MAKYGENIGKSWEIPELNGGFWLGKSSINAGTSIARFYCLRVHPPRK
jgi:hypothetical protein